jgi:predicted enzyme related to lactoylglutathione lyase
VRVIEAFFHSSVVRKLTRRIPVADMERARQFYVRAFDASVQYASPVWSSLRIAQVRLTLNARSSETALKTGLHLVVNSLELASDVIVTAGGVVVTDPIEIQPGMVVADAADTERNVFTLLLASED